MNEYDKICKRFDDIILKMHKYVDLQKKHGELQTKVIKELGSIDTSVFMGAPDSTIAVYRNLVASSENDDKYADYEFGKALEMYRNCTKNKTMTAQQYNEIMAAVDIGLLSLQSSCDKLTHIPSIATVSTTVQ